MPTNNPFRQYDLPSEQIWTCLGRERGPVQGAGPGLGFYGVRTPSVDRQTDRQMNTHTHARATENITFATPLADGKYIKLIFNVAILGQSIKMRLGPHLQGQLRLFVFIRKESIKLLQQ